MPKAHVTALPTLFTVSMPRPHTHLFEIEMRPGGSGGPAKRAPRGTESFDLILPAWTPGSYLVRDFARHVQDVTARDARGRGLPVEKVEKNRWRVFLEAGLPLPITIRYKVFAHELSVRTSHLDASHGYGNGANLFFYVDGRKDKPQALRFALPKGWKVSIALPEEDGVFRAADYDELVDSPFECGTHRTLVFRVRGVPHTVAIWGRGNEDEKRLVRDLRKLVEEAACLFRGLPYERYLFLVHLQAGASGGLEHRASQSVGIAPWKFRPESAYREVLALLSHELFHAWNAKRIHPAALGPFDYTKEVYTKDLWIMEGITSYYEDLLLVRAGLITPKQLFAETGKVLKAHRENPGSRIQTAEMASFDTWIRLYRPDENSPNVSESYYRRGALLGLALDLTLRRATRGRNSLDDVIRLLFRHFRRQGRAGKGYPDGAFEDAVRAVLGRSPKAFFDRYVRGTLTPRFEALLADFGLVLREKPEKPDKGEDGEEPAAPPRRADCGWKTKKDNGRLLVSEVYAGRSAYEAGVAAGDELVALDGVKADDDHVARVEKEGAPGTRIAVTVFRRSRLETISVRLGARRAFTYEIVADRKASRASKALAAGWLRVPFASLP
jgi:predicted metalloprotease with PDZ domain